MLILDTDHVSEIERQSDAGMQLAERLDRSGQAVATTIITVDEQLRGLLRSVKRARQPALTVRQYGRRQSYLENLTDWTSLPWNDASEFELSRLNAIHVRIGAMDLRIASIAIANTATLLSRNIRDFQRVPGLRVEDWH